jgi:hypothetical protein
MYEKGKIAQFGRFFVFYLHISKKSTNFAAENEMVINLGGQNYGTPNCRNTRS